MTTTMMMDINRAWTCITNALSIQPTPITQLDGPDLPVDFELALDTLYSHGLDCGVLREWFFEVIQRRFSTEIAPVFWREFAAPIPEKDVTHVIRNSIGHLFDDMETCLTLANRLERDDVLQLEGRNADTATFKEVRDRLLLIIKATVFSGAPNHFVNAIHCLLSMAFRAYRSKFSTYLDESGTTSDDGCDLLLLCAGCESEPDSCHCEYTLEVFHAVVSWLDKLEVLERITSEPAMLLVRQRIEQHVATKCQGNFDIQYMSSLIEWLDNKVISWLEELFQLSSCHNEAIFPAHRDQLHYFLYETFGRARIRQLFTIIVEYPESEPALLDLSQCIEHVPELRTELVQSLRSDLETRLLHPGVDTNDILTAYVSAIRGLRVLEPSGVLLDAVCSPVCKYLRSREDTVRCIVTSLTNKHSELADELVKPHPLTLDEGDANDSDDDIVIAAASISDNGVEHATDWERWQPHPVDTYSSSGSGSTRAGDIISMLVNIYGTADLFVNEYRQLLADRLLTQFSFDTHRDVRHVELLKLRFGEPSMHNCEVMLKDISDSRRINSRISEEKAAISAVPAASSENIPVSAVIISEQFWPPRKLKETDAPLLLPPCLRDALDNFTRSFEMLKGNRTLSWKSHLGLVDIELELPNGRLVPCKASLAHATIIWHFEKQSRWTVKDLASSAQMPAHAVRRRIALWQSKGLLCEESTDTFLLVENETHVPGTAVDIVAVDDDEDTCESAVADARERREEELSVVWSYVVGMLTNLESLPLERIYSMLRMFAMQGPGSQVSQQDLRTFLDHKVKEQKLIYMSGVYRLPKH